MSILLVAFLFRQTTAIRDQLVTLSLPCVPLQVVCDRLSDLGPTKYGAAKQLRDEIVEIQATRLPIQKLLAALAASCDARWAASGAEQWLMPTETDTLANSVFKPSPSSTVMHLSASDADLACSRTLAVRSGGSPLQGEVRQKLLATRADPLDLSAGPTIAGLGLAFHMPLVANVPDSAMVQCDFIVDMNQRTVAKELDLLRPSVGQFFSKDGVLVFRPTNVLAARKARTPRTALKQLLQRAEANHRPVLEDLADFASKTNPQQRALAETCCEMLYSYNPAGPRGRNWPFIDFYSALPKVAKQSLAAGASVELPSVGPDAVKLAGNVWSNPAGIDAPGWMMRETDSVEEVVLDATRTDLSASLTWYKAGDLLAALDLGIGSASFDRKRVRQGKQRSVQLSISKNETTKTASSAEYFDFASDYGTLEALPGDIAKQIGSRRKQSQEVFRRLKELQTTERARQPPPERA